jgi:hypothetical protein
MTIVSEIEFYYGTTRIAAVTFELVKWNDKGRRILVFLNPISIIEISTEQTSFTNVRTTQIDIDDDHRIRNRIILWDDANRSCNFRTSEMKRQTPANSRLSISISVIKIWTEQTSFMNVLTTQIDIEEDHRIRHWILV